MNPTNEGLVQKIRRYDLEPYRCFHRKFECGLEWLILMTKLNGNIWFQPVLYRKPVDMELWVAEANIDDLPFEIEDEGEAMLEKAEPLELFLAKFERQFEVSEDEAGAVLREILDGIQYFVCQKQTVGKQGLVIDRSPSGHAA